ncbi:MAG TPA: glyoxalase, partial [Cytophagales bacterium]|nr:glyoxalase [Cytophagales bacterium]
MLLLLLSCVNKEDNEKTYRLGAIGAFSEAIDAGVKQLALSATLTKDEMDKFLPDATEVAQKHDVLVYREPDLLVTDLFPEDVAKDKEVLLLY